VGTYCAFSGVAEMVESANCNELKTNECAIKQKHILAVAINQLLIAIGISMHCPCGNQSATFRWSGLLHW
jgi:hypothetical protein